MPAQQNKSRFSPRAYDLLCLWAEVRSAVDSSAVDSCAVDSGAVDSSWGVSLSSNWNQLVTFITIMHYCLTAQTGSNKRRIHRWATPSVTFLAWWPA